MVKHTIHSLAPLTIYGYVRHKFPIMYAVADLRGKRGTCDPRGSKFFQFHAVFGKIWENRMLAPPGELAPPPRGNAGSATGMGFR